MSRKPRIEKECQICKIQFTVYPCDYKRKVCGLKCSGELTKLRPKILGRSPSEITRKKISEANIGKKAWNKGLKGYLSGEKHHWFGRNCTGENNPAYKYDRSLLKKSGNAEKDRRSSAYVTWRTAVWKRDGYKCKIANKDCCGKIEAHHILPYREFEELRYQINNGITLCHFHHPRKREDEKRLSPYFTGLVSVSKE